MPDEQPKDQTLAVDVKDGKLIISIGISALAFAIKNGANFVNETFDITDEEGFAKDIADALEADDGAGDTPVHALLDQAAMTAVENGSDHCEWAEAD